MTASDKRSYGDERRRVVPHDQPFGDRPVREPMELTSRVSTDQVALAKQRLEAEFLGQAETVDVALATNMISVGLDITRLGLMVVQGQPKTAAEYIQATSRVGRDHKASRRRRLVRWNDLDSKGRRKFEFDDGRKSHVTPIRFVCACDNGHLDDINWRYAVHGPDACAEAMYIEEKGTSADPADTSVVCGCGRRLSLQDLFQPGRLGKCQGQRPWLVDRTRKLTPKHSNVQFPAFVTCSLPFRIVEGFRAPVGVLNPDMYDPRSRRRWAMGI
jgi:hypothetical protein